MFFSVSRNSFRILQGILDNYFKAHRVLQSEEIHDPFRSLCLEIIIEYMLNIFTSAYAGAALKLTKPAQGNKHIARK